MNIFLTQQNKTISEESRDKNNLSIHGHMKYNENMNINEDLSNNNDVISYNHPLNERKEEHDDERSNNHIKNESEGKLLDKLAFFKFERKNENISKEENDIRSEKLINKLFEDRLSIQSINDKHVFNKSLSIDYSFNGFMK